MSAAERIGLSNCGPSPFTKSNCRPIGLEREQQVGEQDGRVDLDRLDRLEGHLRRQIGGPAQLQHAVLLA